MRLKIDNSRERDYRTFWLAPREIAGVRVAEDYTVGRVHLHYPYGRGGALTQLCSLHFAGVCDVAINADGVIDSLQIK